MSGHFVPMKAVGVPLLEPHTPIVTASNNFHHQLPFILGCGCFGHCSSIIDSRSLIYITHVSSGNTVTPWMAVPESLVKVFCLRQEEH